MYGQTGLNRVEKIFIQEYIIDQHPARAYQRVNPGTTLTSANTAAKKLLAKPEVKARIELLLYERQRKHQRVMEATIERLNLLAGANVRSVISDIENGVVKLKNYEDLTEDDLYTIKKIYQKTTAKETTTHIEMKDTIPALKEITEILGLKMDLNQVMNVLRRHGYNLKIDPTGNEKWALEEIDPNAIAEPDTTTFDAEE